MLAYLRAAALKFTYEQYCTFLNRSSLFYENLGLRCAEAVSSVISTVICRCRRVKYRWRFASVVFVVFHQSILPCEDEILKTFHTRHTSCYISD